MSKFTSADIALANAKLGTNFPLNSSIIAMDADYIGGAPQTVANAGIPAMLTTFFVPKWIETVVAPMRLAEALPEKQFGDRTTTNIEFPMYELYGETSSYGDYNDNGIATSNENYEFRQPYAYQINIKIGDIEEERAGAARFSLVERKVNSAQLALNKTQNSVYLYGVQGLKNYGILNDPNLLPDLVGINWQTATAEQIFVEIQRMYTQLVTQTKGLVTLTDSLTLLLSPIFETYLTKTNQYGLNVYDLVKKNFPNIKIHSVAEYSTATGEKMQLILDSYMGQNTVDLGFVDKLRTHRVDTRSSHYSQKRSQSTIGAIVYYPIFVVGYLGQNTA